MTEAAVTAGWRDIESAPKDGTRIILAWPHAREGYWLDNSGTKYQPWSGWKLTAMDPWPQGQPTHWMPLPEPPTPSGEEQKEDEDGNLSLRGASVSADLRTAFPASIESPVAPLPGEGGEDAIGALEKQLYEHVRKADFDPHPDDEFDVMLKWSCWKHLEELLALRAPAPVGGEDYHKRFPDADADAAKDAKAHPWGNAIEGLIDNLRNELNSPEALADLAKLDAALLARQGEVERLKSLIDTHFDEQRKAQAQLAAAQEEIKRLETAILSLRPNCCSGPCERKHNDRDDVCVRTGKVDAALARAATKGA